MIQKIPRKCWPIGIGFVLAAFMAATSALACSGLGTPEVRETGPPAQLHH